jgi:hypothetical protein
VFDQSLTGNSASSTSYQQVRPVPGAGTWAAQGKSRQAASTAANLKESIVTTTYVETWKGIAGALGRSERWCRYMARRSHDPLPVFKVGGIVRLNGIDLEDWLSRQRDRSIVRGVDAALTLVA